MKHTDEQVEGMEDTLVEHDSSWRRYGSSVDGL